MKKAVVLLLLILLATMASTTRLHGERKCDELPLLMGEAPRETVKGGDELTVISLNMYEETDVGRILNELRSVEALRNADILLLQEVVKRPSEALSMARNLADALNMYYAFAPAAPRQQDTERGIAILSRYELRDPKMVYLKPYNLVFRSRCRVALAVTVDTNLGSIRVVNVHLDNRLNTRQKIAQLSPVLDYIKQHSGPRIVGGDFNTGDILWLSHVIPVPYAQKQSSAMHSLMTEHGFATPFGYAPTFDLLGLRLDWIFHKELRPVAQGIEPIDFSDHHAIWVRLARVEPASQKAAAGGQ